MNYNIPTDVLHELNALFTRYSAIEKVALFGSRARGDHTPKSDIDIAVFSKTMPKEHFKLLQLELSELPILHHIDSVHFEKSTKALQDNIQREGLTIFKQAPLA